MVQTVHDESDAFLGDCIELYFLGEEPPNECQGNVDLAVERLGYSRISPTQPVIQSCTSNLNSRFVSSGVAACYGHPMPISFSCRPACAACCIAPSITTPLPGHPHGKPAGVACANLTVELRCGLWKRPERPAFCGGLQPSAEMCGERREHAMTWLGALEQATRP